MEILNGIALRRKPRAIAINPAPNGWCHTAGIRHLLEPKRCVVFLAKLNPSASEKSPEVRASVGIVRAPSGVPDHHFTMPLVTLYPPTMVEPPYSLANRMSDW